MSDGVSDEVFKATCKQAFGVFEADLRKMVEQNLNVAAVGQAALFAAEVMLGSALRTKRLTPAEVRLMFERSIDGTLKSGAK